MSLIKIAQRAKAEGLRPIDCPELMAQMSLGALAVICEVWDIKQDKYHPREQSAEYARRYPGYTGKGL